MPRWQKIKQYLRLAQYVIELARKNPKYAYEFLFRLGVLAEITPKKAEYLLRTIKHGSKTTVASDRRQPKVSRRSGFDSQPESELNESISGLNSVCLIVFFNHRYEENIEKLERLYRKRFSHIYFLVPFYQGDSPNVIPVYESSSRFHGFFTQAFYHLRQESFSHYIFLADDLILNPYLNEHNILDQLQLDNETGYIKEVTSLSEINPTWTHLATALGAFWRQNPYVDFWKELPQADQAVAKMVRLGIDIGPIPLQRILPNKNVSSDPGYNDAIEALAFFVKEGVRQVHIPYPLLASYSDFVIVPEQSFREFSHICGIFAAMDLFVEVAVPTALALSCEYVKHEKQTNWVGVEYWGLKRASQIENSHHLCLEHLLSSFDKNCLYIHPIKLSKWRFCG